MEKFRSILKNTAISIGIMAFFNSVSILLRFTLNIRSMVPMFFVLSVFFISLCTEGYFYGVVFAFISAAVMNYLFITAGNSLEFSYDIITTTVIIMSVALLTCTLVTTLKRNRRIRARILAEQMRANLLRAVSHDLRTPLTSIYASSSVILESSEALDEDQQRALVEKIQTESHGLIRILENLLSVTRVNEKDVKITKTPTVLWELVDAVVVHYNRYFPNQPLEVDIPEDFVTIPMDSMLIDQVIFNILENANIHAKDMTKLKLKVELKGDDAVFEISDNGCDVTKEKVERMFEGYFESHSTGDYSGRHNLGIGLSVCKAIINVHGGKIYAKSNEMGGISVFFTLKMEANDEQQV